VRGHLALLVTAAVAASVAFSPQQKSLKVGQEWQFEARPDDPRPTLVIDRIDTLPKVGEVVHVSVRGVRIRNPGVPGGIQDQIPHLPFARSALEKSLTKVLHDSVPLPAYEEGYAEWKRAQGGAFTITVREVLDLAEQATR